MAIPFFNDLHDRVRYSAVHCIGQLAEDFGEVEKGKNFQAKFHAAVIPCLINMIQGTEVIQYIATNLLLQIKYNYFFPWFSMS